MKKLLFAFLFLPFFSFVASDWSTVALADNVSISFPSEPKIKDSDGNTIWQSLYDSTTIYMAMKIDFQKFGLDSAGVFTEMNSEEGYEGFKSGMIQQMPGATLISSEKRIVNGLITYDLIVDLAETSKPFTTSYNHSVIVGTNLYSMSVICSKKNLKEDMRKKFFDSFKVK